MLAPRGHISVIRQVHHPRFSPDVIRFASFFNTASVHAAAEFRFVIPNNKAQVLAEASTFLRLLVPGTSHISTVVSFSGDMTTVDPRAHPSILVSLRDWGEELASSRSQLLARRGEKVVNTNNIDLDGIRALRQNPAIPLPALTAFSLKWTRDSEHPAVNEDVELLIIQAWRTGVEGDLLGFVFGSVEAVHRQPIVGELLILLTQLLDDLPLDVISHCDESPAPHILSCSLTPYLQRSACLEGDWDNRSYPSHSNYLNPAEIIDLLFLDQGETTSEDEEEEEEEEEEYEEDKEDEEEGDELKDTSEEDGYYSEHSEHESGAISEGEEEEEEEEASEKEEAEQAGTQGEDPAEAERRRAEIAEGKQPLEQSVGTELPVADDPTRDQEPPTEEDERCAAETSSAPTRRQWSRSPSPSPRPLVRARADAGHRAMSPVIISSSP
ncbi:hypothetical protein CBR_g38225 [Chara braunii]|uniref:Uncharacterized protein n=1 Tax=Chara braunii TaxID=69332 RepID=A0A388LPM9_CHABU|nr:hypothetical protein CBR_g38225 [Chara braunii]|eukprot:GBG84254.1 hypothetical protein CBR_g38225 [Chara braunii]